MPDEVEIDYRRLFVEALENNKDDTRWSEGDFVGIKTISNTKVGSVGQDFIEKLCTALSIQCVFPLRTDKERARQSPWDIEIDGVKFELKTATQDTTSNFQFNHVRYHRPYDAVLCLGVTPSSLYFGVWSKADVVTGKAGNLVSMEKGANASYKLTKKPSQLMPITSFGMAIPEFIAKFKSS